MKTLRWLFIASAIPLAIWYQKGGGALAVYLLVCAVCFGLLLGLLWLESRRWK